jgi:hypothetical protein
MLLRTVTQSGGTAAARGYNLKDTKSFSMSHSVCHCHLAGHLYLLS